MNRLLCSSLSALCAVLWFVTAKANALVDADHDVIASGLDHPWSIAFLPDGRYLVTERSGRLLLVDAESDTRHALHFEPGDLWVDGQAGLFEVALHPRFEENNWVYISYACGDRIANNTCLTRAQLIPDEEKFTLSEPEMIFRAQPERRGSAHYGARIAFLPDQTLVLTLGDGFDYREDAQLPGSHNGKIVRLTEDGKTPPDNPFSQSDKHRPEIYSMGHRNVQGIAWDEERQILWSTEHGPRGGDELNRIEAGNNYGWPLITGGKDYTGAMISPHKDLPGMTSPVIDWTPSIAPAGLALYRGNLFVPALAARKVVQVHLDSEGQVTDQTTHLESLGERIRDIKVNPHTDSLYILTDSPAGKILRIN